MGKIKNEYMTRCELALMGKVVPCNNDEVQTMTEYILSAMGKEDENVDILKDHIHKYDGNHKVKYIVCNTVEGMKCITYLLDSGVEDKEDEEYYPAPFEEDYGSGYPCSFCYVLNLDMDDFSEFGDCFFSKKSDGFYHRVS